MTQTPALKIITSFGGHAVVAELLGLAVSAVYRWDYPKSRGGTGGLIPQRHHAALLKVARERDIAVAPQDFMLIEEAA